MSFRVLVIPEDPTQNGYILKPLIEAILADAGKQHARVVVLSNPRLMGYDHAVKAIRETLPERYGFWDLWIFLPDADRATADAVLRLEGELVAKGIRLIGCIARPEVEVYACVAFRDEMPGGWQMSRQHPRFKEEVFPALLGRYGDDRRPGGGRDLMMNQSLGNMARLYELCPELLEMRDRIRRSIDQG